MPQLLISHILDQIPELSAVFKDENRTQLHEYIFSLARPDLRTAHRIVVTEGNIANSIHFLLSGKAQCFYYSEPHRREIAPFLLLAPCILAEGKSVLKKRSARFSIDVSDGSVLYSLSAAAIRSAIEKYPRLEGVVKQRVKAQTHRFKTWKEELMMLTAKERYLKLRANQPDVINLFLKKHIAAHLAITEQSFSRLLNEINCP